MRTDCSAWWWEVGLGTAEDAVKSLPRASGTGDGRVGSTWLGVSYPGGTQQQVVRDTQEAASLWPLGRPCSCLRPVAVTQTLKQGPGHFWAQQAQLGPQSSPYGEPLAISTWAMRDVSSRGPSGLPVHSSAPSHSDWHVALAQ